MLQSAPFVFLLFAVFIWHVFYSRLHIYYYHYYSMVLRKCELKLKCELLTILRNLDAFLRTNFLRVDRNQAFCFLVSIIIDSASFYCFAYQIDATYRMLCVCFFFSFHFRSVLICLRLLFQCFVSVLQKHIFNIRFNMINWKVNICLSRNDEYFIKINCSSKC